jgi:hypothetical protein
MEQSNEEPFEFELVVKPRINRNREKKIIKTVNYEQVTKRRHQREQIKMEWIHKRELLAFEGKEIVYPNQQLAADMVIQAYEQGVLAVCLIAQPGTGKTGCAQAIMYHYATHDEDEKFIFSGNMIVCSGMSDTDWKDQFKAGLTTSFQSQVYHRQDLLKQEDKLCDLKNGLIIPDECHIASQKTMTVAKCMKNAGLLDIEGLKARNIKTLDISATPEAVLHDYEKWGPLARTIKIQPGLTYKGFEHMISDNRIIDAPSLETYDDIAELLETFEARYENSPTKKYFPFRLFNEEKKALIRVVCDDLDWTVPLEHNSESRIDDIDKMMASPPNKHTICFVKGFWRASKRLVRAHVGGSYEQKPKKTDMTNTAQSLTGRFCDNYEYSGDQLDPLNRPLHYCDKAAIEGYVEWFNHDCDFTASEYKSLRINSNGDGKVKSKASKVHHTLVTNLPTSEVMEEEEEEEEDTYRIYDDEDTVKNVCKLLGYNYVSVKEKNINADGFILTTINNARQIVSLEQAIKNNKARLKPNAKGKTIQRTFYPCYVNIADKTTIRFVVVIKSVTMENKTLLESLDTLYPGI